MSHMAPDSQASVDTIGDTIEETLDSWEQLYGQRDTCGGALAHETTGSTTYAVDSALNDE